MKKFKMSTTMSELELYSIFGRSARCMGGAFYYIFFNGKDFSAETPKELFDKVKSEYADYCKKQEVTS